MPNYYTVYGNSKLRELKFYAITKVFGNGGTIFFRNGYQSNAIKRAQIANNTTKSNFERLIKATIIYEIKSTKYGNEILSIYLKGRK